MLQVIDKRTKRLLDLADFIERSDDYNQLDWCTCIAGQAYRMLHGKHWRDGRDPTVRVEIADAFDIDPLSAVSLFVGDGSYTKHQAASTVRHYALTGNVDWSIGDDRTGDQVLPDAEPVPVPHVGRGAIRRAYDYICS